MKKMRIPAVALICILLPLALISGCSNPAGTDVESPPPPPVLTWTPKEGYLNTPLDPWDPVAFYGNEVGWRVGAEGGMAKYMSLGEDVIYLDGSFTDDDIGKFRADGYNYVFNDFKEAMDAASADTTVLIAPWVYWIWDPDAPGLVGEDLPHPGYTMNDNPNMTWWGMNGNFDNVVIAGNRGSMAGATVFAQLFGGGPSTGTTTFENLTIGNFTNFDIEYPLDVYLPEGQKLSRPARQDAITQSHIGGRYGNYVIAKNVHFASKHNASPPTGSSGTLYYRSKIQGGHHSLPWGNTQVYLDSDIYLHTLQNGGAMGGASLLNCDIYLAGLEGEQGFGDGASGASGLRPAMIDCRIHGLYAQPDFMWNRSVPDNFTGFYSNVTYDGEPYVMEPGQPWVSVDITGKDMLKAYKFEDPANRGLYIYNTFEILRGNANWDPLYIRSLAEAAGAVDIPRYLNVSVSGNGTINTENGDSRELSWEIGGTTAGTNDQGKIGAVTWRIHPDFADYESLVTTTDKTGVTWTVTANNNTTQSRAIVFEAIAESGLRGSAVLTVLPPLQTTPALKAAPVIGAPVNGELTVSYELTNFDPALYQDYSIVNWYRADDSAGNVNKVLVATTRPNNLNANDSLTYRPPVTKYYLMPQDEGKYIIAEVTPQHSLSAAGLMATASSTQITAANIVKNELHIDFNGFVVPPNSNTDATRNMTPVAGTWHIDAARSFESEKMGGAAHWSVGGSGGANYNNSVIWSVENGTGVSDPAPGIRMNGFGSRIGYTPPAGVGGGDMEVSWKLGASKPGQGFSHANYEYMDVFVNFDFLAGTGYALRIQRTARQGNAAEFGLMRYKGWEAYADAVYPAPRPEEVEDDFPAEGTPKRANSRWWDTRPASYAFATMSYITLKTETAGGVTRLIVDVTTDKVPSAEQAALPDNVHLEWPLEQAITSNQNGFGLWVHTETYVGASINQCSISLRQVDARWK